MLRTLMIVLLISTAGHAAANERIRIHGSNTVGETLAPMLVRAWLQARGATALRETSLAAEERLIHAQLNGADIELELHAHGSSTAFSDLATGSTDLGMSSRPVRPIEVEQLRALGALDSPGQETVIALDGLSVIVHHANPLQQLSVSQVRAIFSGRVRDWSQLGAPAGRIALHARDNKSGTWDTFKTLVLQDQPLASWARRYESTQELSDAVAADPDAVGFVGLVGIGSTRALAISDGGLALRPERFAVAVEDYPLSRRLFFYAPATRSRLAENFIAFTVSEQGQQVVERAGFVSQDVRAYDSQPPETASPAYVDNTHDAQRLSLNFRFGSGSAYLDGKALRDVGRLVEYMGRPENGGMQLRLLGFADTVESIPLQALKTSSDRADTIAEALARKGVPVYRVRGFGGSAPVASDATAHGRYRNRRVEVWVAPGVQTAAR